MQLSFCWRLVSTANKHWLTEITVLATDMSYTIKTLFRLNLCIMSHKKYTSKRYASNSSIETECNKTRTAAGLQMSDFF